MENKNNIDYCDVVLKIANCLTDHKAMDVVVLDLRQENVWTSFFIVATVMSAPHAIGLEKYLEEEIQKLALMDFYQKRKHNDGGEWKLIDLGEIVAIHLMSKMARNFYDLENLHRNAKKIYESDAH